MTRESFERRQCQPEWMDEPDADPVLLDKSLAFIRRVNRWLGYTRATLTHLQRFAVRWEPGRTIRILDVATGSADIPRAMLAWARRAGHDVEVTAVDLHEKTLDAARAGSPDPRLILRSADALALPFDDASFDYVHTAMFLHHLPDEQVVTAMRNMHRVASRGVIVADLVRCRRAYGWIKLFTMTSNPMVRHDARVSVLQAFTRDEIMQLRDRAGMQYADYVPHFGHRFVLAGEKP